MGDESGINVHAKISELKNKLGSSVCILGHHYQSDGVAAHCDIMGDSLELARKIADIDAEHIVFCGVYFMGETAALLAAPNQKVYLPEPDADCMMSLMASEKLARSVLKELKKSGRKVIPLAYVNTMLELKNVVGEYGGAVCTSANAQQMLEWALTQGDSVLFLPDKNLGRNVAKKIGIPGEEQYILKLTGKGLAPGQEDKLSAKLLLWPGSCAVHAKLSPGLVDESHKNNKCFVLAHPECKPELIEKCDGAGSTSFLIKETEKIAREAPGSEVVIGTEENLVERLSNKYADKLKIRPLGHALCPHMEKVTPEKLLKTLGEIAEGDGDSLTIDKKKSENARLSITRMLDVCKK